MAKTSASIRDILTAFSPTSEFLAITAGDGRIKIWDTLKGYLQIDFAEIASTDMTNFSQRGHLSVDYTCMKWMHLEAKNKRKSGLSLLILGTGGGDLLAIDISVGQLRWRVSDCHPGGVSAISFSTHGLYIYSTGSDGMVCQIDGRSGNVLVKFKSSMKAVSSISISSDGELLAVASAQLKVFNCSSFEKIQKFSGHPALVRCMIFTEDGKYILSSAIGERFIAIWKISTTKKKSCCCVLSMDYPAIFLDTKGTINGVLVLAISETGVCYFWYGKNIEDLQNTRATKISLSTDCPIPRSSSPIILAGILQGSMKPAAGMVFVAYGSIVKPTFEKLHVHHGTDISLEYSHDGILLPKFKTVINQRKDMVKYEVTTLDRTNIEDALFPVPKIRDFHQKKRKHGVLSSNVDLDEVIPDNESCHMDMTEPIAFHDDQEEAGGHIENKLRSLGLFSEEEELKSKIHPDEFCKIPFNSLMLGDANLLVQSNVRPKKIRMIISSMSGSDAYKLLRMLMSMWTSRSDNGKHIFVWMYTILRNHGQYILSQESSSQILDTLSEMASARSVALQSLSRLSGHLQLIMAQIDKAGQDTVHTLPEVSGDSESETEVDEVIYGEEDVSENDSEEDISKCES